MTQTFFASEVERERLERHLKDIKVTNLRQLRQARRHGLDRQVFGGGSYWYR